jgi:hypothetical protein
MNMIMPINSQQDFTPQKLTKGFLMSLPAGVYLVSNCFADPQNSIFAEHVAPLSERGAQWVRIRASHADQRNCHVFKDEMQFRNWVAEGLRAQR